MHNIDNLPEQGVGVLRLTPRSSEALKRTGYTLGMITKKSREEINAGYGDRVDDHELILKRWEHEEEKRVARLRELQAVRRQIAKEMESQGGKGSITGGAVGPTSTMIQK
jgi:hypothetical protein